MQPWLSLLAIPLLLAAPHAAAYHADPCQNDADITIAGALHLRTDNQGRTHFYAEWNNLAGLQPWECTYMGALHGPDIEYLVL